MQQEQEKGLLFSAIIKALLIGVALFAIFGKKDKIKDFFESIIDEPVADEIIWEESDDEIESTDYIEYTNEVVFTEDSAEIIESEIFSVVETMPRFKGCENLEGDAATQCTMKKIQNYTSRVKYPQIAIDNDIEGKVYIRFVVDTKGYVSEVKILRGVDKLLDKAALNHIKRMPKFDSPGMQKGKAVKVQYNIPIVFKLG